MLRFVEPPHADPHVRWCGEGVGRPAPYPISRIGPERQLESTSFFANVLDRNRRGKSSIPISSRGSSVGIGASGSSVLVLSIAALVFVIDRQASVCLPRASRPRTNQTVTSEANPRRQRSNEIKWANLGNDDQQHAPVTSIVAQPFDYEHEHRRQRD